MPTITTLRDVNKKYKKNKVQYKSPKQYTREKLYQLPQWRKLRNTYLMKHPLDELELINNKIIPAEHIHHIISPFDYDDIEVAKVFLLDEDNLLSLSAHTHGLVHGNPKLLSPKQHEYIRYKIANMRAKLLSKLLNII